MGWRGAGLGGEALVGGEGAAGVGLCDGSGIGGGVLVAVGEIVHDLVDRRSSLPKGGDNF